MRTGIAATLASFAFFALDGLIRFDVAKGIYPEKKVRANLYVEGRF